VNRNTGRNTIGRSCHKFVAGSGEFVNPCRGLLPGLLNRLASRVVSPTNSSWIHAGSGTLFNEEFNEPATMPPEDMAEVRLSSFPIDYQTTAERIDPHVASID
jgi:hypothetical protein